VILVGPIEPSVPVPRPSSGQVLIKVVAAAINPSDYGTWTRTKAEHCPLAMGSEGCGVVVALGGGLATYAAGVKVGSKVGFVKLPFRQGAYSEYVVADVVGGVFPMPDDLPVESAASFFTNPYTGETEEATFHHSFTLTLTLTLPLSLQPSRSSTPSRRKVPRRLYTPQQHRSWGK
jgi:NADPH:quinone reductase-like Zn-dependent oxidoreductase